MVFLAITADGLKQALSLAEHCQIDIWCGADSMSESDFHDIRSSSLSRFVYPLSGQSPEVLSDAIDTIKEHHPGATIWVEQVA